MHRHPGLRFASIESGSEWVPTLFKKTARVYKQQPHSFPEDPHEGLRTPADYAAELDGDGFDADEVRLIMRDNGLRLSRRAPSTP